MRPSWAAPVRFATLADRDPFRQPFDRFFRRGLQSKLPKLRRGRVQKRYVRLTGPLVRELGELRPASWDEALERVAGQFRKTLAENGPDSIGIQLLAGDQRGELPRPEARPGRLRQSQHRQL